MDHPRRKRIEIVVEAVFTDELTALLSVAGAPGWTVVPVLAGYGHRGPRSGGDLGRVNDNVMVVAIVNDAVAEKIFAALRGFMDDRVVIVSMTDVVVLRGEHF